MNRRYLAIPIALLLTACAPVARTGGLTTESADFNVEAFPETRGGRPVVTGSVYNKRPLRATQVRLRVEALDAAGAAVASGVRPLDRDIESNDHAYFEVTPPAGAAAYRVTVEYVFWSTGGGGA
jgi:hypothetical protein